MNAQKKLDDAAATIRALTIERDALKSKCEVQRKALAHEAMETVKLRAELDALKQAAKEFRHAIPLDVLRMKAGNGFLDMERADNAAARLEGMLE